MSGGNDRDSTAQLALMDALVFFIAAMVISSILLYYSAPKDETPLFDHGQGSAAPDEVLKALLRSSIGSNIVVPLDVPRHISRDTDIGQCLLLEAEAVLDGMAITSFDELNGAIDEVLVCICSPMYVPALAVLSSEATGSRTLISIRGASMDSPQMLAATSELSSDDENDLLVQLILCPSALSEVVQVLLCDLDLGSSVSSASPELYP